MTNQELMIEADMLQGNINRMFVTNDVDELERMYRFAANRLQTIYIENKERLRKNNKNPWYSLNERYPEPGKHIEVKLNNETIHIDKMCKGKYGNYEFVRFHHRDVIAWRELK